MKNKIITNIRLVLQFLAFLMCSTNCNDLLIFCNTQIMKILPTLINYKWLGRDWCLIIKFPIPNTKKSKKQKWTVVTLRKFLLSRYTSSPIILISNYPAYTSNKERWKSICNLVISSFMEYEGYKVILIRQENLVDSNQTNFSRYFQFRFSIQFWEMFGMSLRKNFVQ